MAWFRKSRRKGQVTPFLIAIIVILLIAIMATVNLGKISLTRTATSNAADAGALAGASTMANGLNAIGDISDGMLADYIATQAILASCRVNCGKVMIIYAAHLASQLALYAYTRKIASDTLEQAESSAKQLAFSNAGIDEGKTRQGNETYEEWLQRKSPFEEWMEGDGFESGEYRWQDTQKYGQTASAGENYVRVSAQAPSWGVIPLPGGIFWIAWVPCKKGKCCICIGGGPTLYGIAAVTGATDPIRMSVSRVEPDIHIGLWQMRYRREGESGITSVSSGHAYGGSVLPFGSDYDSELTEAN